MRLLPNCLNDCVGIDMRVLSTCFQQVQYVDPNRNGRPAIFICSVLEPSKLLFENTSLHRRLATCTQTSGLISELCRDDNQAFVHIQL